MSKVAKGIDRLRESSLIRSAGQHHIHLAQNSDLILAGCIEAVQAVKGFHYEIYIGDGDGGQLVIDRKCLHHSHKAIKVAGWPLI